jgi:hypothetical protein
MSRLFLACIVFLFIHCSIVSATDYYIKNGGNNSADGKSDANAWATLSKVNSSSFSPGDIIHFRCGDTWRESLDVSWAGTSGAYIKFTSYGTGKNPRFVGSNVTTGWTSAGTNIWKSNSTFTNPRYLGAGDSDDISFENTDGTTTWGEYKSGTGSLSTEYNWTWSSNYIYVYATSNPTTKYTSVEVPQRDVIIYANNNEYLHFDGIDILYSGYIGITYSVHTEILDVSGFIVENCEIAYIGGTTTNQYGFGIDCLYSDMIIRKCEIHHCGRRGISFNLGGGGATFTVTNVLIEDCVFHNGSHTTALDCTVNNSGNESSINGLIFRRNLVYEDPKSSVSYQNNSVWFQRYSGSGSITNVYFYSNIFKYWRGCCIATEGFNGNFYIYNNTFYESNTSTTPSYCLYSDTDRGTAHFYVKNNIFYNTLPTESAGSGALIVLYGIPSSYYICDYNLYYRTSNSLRIMLINGSSYYMNGQASIKNSLIWEVHGIFVEPVFISTTNYHLQQGSPAIGKGTKPISLTDFEGKQWNNPPSIGALEFNTPPPPDTLAQKAIVLYPNPCHRTFTILREGSDLESQEFRVINLSGKIIYKNVLEKGEMSKCFSIDLDAGIYLVQVSSSNLEPDTQKLILINF